MNTNMVLSPKVDFGMISSKKRFGRSPKVVSREVVMRNCL
jgi:hypothetical protein